MHCALSFTGSGNSLTLVGDSSLASGVKGAGVRVESVYEGTSSLEIKGEGRLTATGGYGSAGIGGGDGGEITISSGTVTAIGGAEARVSAAVMAAVMAARSRYPAVRSQQPAVYTAARVSAAVLDSTTK